MRKQRETAGSLPGASSLTVIFAVLCIAVFAVLAVSTVAAGKRLSDASVRSTAEWYAADCEAEAVLAAIRSGAVPEGVSREGDRYSWSCRISETRELEVVAEVRGEEYRIVRKQAVYTAPWNAESGMEVWTGGSNE